MSTRLTNSLREQLNYLAGLKVTMRALESDLGKEIGDLHNGIADEAMIRIKTLFPVNEMKILNKWEKGSPCHAVAFDFRNKDKDNYREEFTTLLHSFDQIKNYFIRGTFYEKIRQMHGKPTPGQVPFDPIYKKQNYEKIEKQLPTISQTSWCQGNGFPMIDHDHFYGLNAFNLPTKEMKDKEQFSLFDSLVPDAKILKKMLKDLTDDIDLKLCPYYALIKTATNLEAIVKVWPEAGDIVHFTKSTETIGVCKVMDFDKAAEMIREEMAA